MILVISVVAIFLAAVSLFAASSGNTKGTVTDMVPFKPEAFATAFRCGDQGVSIDVANDPTRLTVFRARGNEPGWQLEIRENRLTLVTNYGETRIEAATPAAETTPAFRRYVAKTDGADLTATIFNRPCADSMSGMPHPNTVEVLLAGKTLQGCGGEPAVLLQGAEWVVEDINGAGIVDNSRATLHFSADGRVAGRASCNTYTGAYTLTGEGLTISKAATTRKACSPALMRQEEAFLEVLRNVQRFEVTPDGALILHAGDRRTITARRPAG